MRPDSGVFGVRQGTRLPGTETCDVVRVSTKVLSVWCFYSMRAEVVAYDLPYDIVGHVCFSLFSLRYHTLSSFFLL